MTDAQRAIAVFILVVAYGLVLLVAGCSAAPTPAPEPKSNWQWDCPGNPLGHDPACVEVSSCGIMVVHDARWCCVDVEGSGGEVAPSSPRARAACE